MIGAIERRSGVWIVLHEQWHTLEPVALTRLRDARHSQMTDFRPRRVSLNEILIRPTTQPL
jgi:hypothetical protein